MDDLDRARDAIRHVLKKVADMLKQDGFQGWQQYFAGYEVVEVSLTYDEIQLLGARATILGDLVTPKQLWMIRSLGREIGVDVEMECSSLLNVPLEEISRRAASSFIQHLKKKQIDQQPKGDITDANPERDNQRLPSD